MPNFNVNLEADFSTIIMSQDKERSEEWSMNVSMTDWGPRRATPEEISAHNNERNQALKVFNLLTKINGLIDRNNLPFYQSEGDGDSGWTSPISVGTGIYKTDIDNHTGQFTLPSVPDEWDENTIVQKQSLFPFGLNNSVYTMTCDQGENDERSVATDA